MKKIIFLLLLCSIGMHTGAYAQCSISSLVNICADGTSTLTLNAVGVSCPSGTKSWTSSNTGVGTVTNSNTTTETMTSVYGGIGTTNITYLVNGVPVASNLINGRGNPNPGTITGPLNMWGGAAGVISLTAVGGLAGGTWSSSNTAVATTSASGHVTGAGVGAANITYTATNVCGSAYTYKQVTVNPYVTIPSNSPVNLKTPSACATVMGLNTALITGNNTGDIIAAVYIDGTGAGWLVINDPTNGGSTTPVALSGTPISTPDVVIGYGTNAKPTSPDDYTIAVAYPTVSGVVVECFDLPDDGTTPINPPSSTNTLTYSCNPANVHIDAIAANNNHEAVVVWDDTFTGEINADFIDLRSSSGTLTAQFIDYGKDPDVAAVDLGTGSYTPWALFTYTDASNNNLYYCDWDVSTTPGTPVILDAAGLGVSVSIPRIDAIDDQTVNGGNPVYKVAAEVLNSGYREVRTYDAQLYGMGPTYWACTDVTNISAYGAAPPYDHFAPTVAYNLSDFMVANFTNDGAQDIVMMQPIAIGAPTALAGTDDYWVSEASGVITGVHASSISTNYNNPNGGTLVAWAYPGATSGCGIPTNIEYKITPSAYSFKQGRQESSSTTQKNWVVYPNPARNQLTVAAYGAGKAGSYEITDMLGRAQLNGNIKNGTQRLDITMLAPGSYVLKINGADGTYSADVFVKE